MTQIPAWLVFSSSVVSFFAEKLQVTSELLDALDELRSASLGNAMSVTALMAFFAAAGGIEVQGSTPCPSAEMVAGLLPLFAPTSPPDVNHVAQLSLKRRPEAPFEVLNIQLLAVDGTEIGTRDVQLSVDCFALAETVAAILATWEGEISVALPSVDAGLILDRPATTSDRRPPATPAFELEAAAAVGSQVLGQLTTDYAIEMSGGKRGNGWQARLGGARQGDRRIEIQPGYVTFSHTYASFRLAWRPAGVAWPVSVDIGPSLGWATISGHGYSVDKKQRTVELGWGGGVRVGRAVGRWQVWADLRLHLWSTKQGVYVRGGSPISSLPTVESSVSIGASCRLIP